MILNDHCKIFKGVPHVWTSQVSPLLFGHVTLPHRLWRFVHQSEGLQSTGSRPRKKCKNHGDIRHIKNDGIWWNHVSQNEWWNIYELYVVYNVIYMYIIVIRVYDCILYACAVWYPYVAYCIRNTIQSWRRTMNKLYQPEMVVFSFNSAGVSSFLLSGGKLSLRPVYQITETTNQLWFQLHIFIRSLVWTVCSSLVWMFCLSANNG